MFRLDNAPVFGQQRPELYDDVFAGVQRDTASVEEIVQATKDFLDASVPNYFVRAVSPSLALEMGVTNCIGRSLLVHTLTAPFSQIDPRIEIKRTAFDHHARNRIVYKRGSSVVLFENFYNKGYTPGHLSEDECVHEAGTKIDWRMNSSLPPDYTERRQVEYALLHDTDENPTVTKEFEQLVKIPSRDDTVTFLLLGRSAGNLLVDAISGAVRTEEHRQITQNFKAYCASGVSA